MTNPQKNKGSAYERSVVTWLRCNGFPSAERTRAGWTDDRGDLDGLVGVTVECKNHRRMELAAWVDELTVEMVNAGNTVGVVIHKRAGIADVSNHYATLPVHVLAALLRGAGYGDPTPTTKDTP